jgi:hypothetical protein
MQKAAPAAAAAAKATAPACSSSTGPVPSSHTRHACHARAPVLQHVAKLLHTRGQMLQRRQQLKKKIIIRNDLLNGAESERNQSMPGLPPSIRWL